MSIEERATEVTSRFSYRNGYQTAKDAYIEGATDQDRIARAEEREECVCAAQDWYRKLRNEPKDSQWYDEVERDCVDLRNFIDHKRGSCDSYVTDMIYEQQEIDIQRAVEWLEGVFLEQYLTTMCSGGYETHVFNDKFFSEFEQAMKGEEK